MKTQCFVTYFFNRNGLVFIISQFFFSFSFLAQFPTSGAGVFDVEGNFYATTILENEQEWMAENLKTKLFSNGDSIQYIAQNSSWQEVNNAAFSIFNNDETNKAVYGNLYNWYVTIDERNICPQGWHVPTDNEWTAYSDLLGGNGVAGGKMKFEDTLFWMAPNLGATNESLFSGLPAGCRYDGGNFANIEKYAYWWTASQLDNQFSWYRSVNYLSDNLVKNYGKKQAGYSIRCLKNKVISVDENDEKLTFLVTPNPFTDNITIKTKEIGKILLLQNMYGETIQSIQLNSNSEVFTAEQLSSGIYFMVDFSTMKRIKLLKF